MSQEVWVSDDGAQTWTQKPDTPFYGLFKHTMEALDGEI